MSRRGLVNVEAPGLTDFQKKPRWVLIRWQAPCNWSELGVFIGHRRLVRLSPSWWHPGITVRPSRASAYVISCSSGRMPGVSVICSMKIFPAS